MKKLPVDVSTFEVLIENDYLYIDKTESIYNLIMQGRYYFLSRPRRFGKSLLLSTLKALFLGKRELFTGLWIDRETDYAWEEHSIIHLDFSTIGAQTSEELKAGIIWTIDSLAKQYNLDTENIPTPSLKLRALVMYLAEKSKVVLLVDEYDNPMLDHIKTPEIAEKQRAILAAFYDGLKGLDEHLHFVFVTGVTKFSKTSIFSGLNNLNDISLVPIAETLLGYTEGELHHYFEPYALRYAQERDTTTEAIFTQLKTWYNGYRFSKRFVKVYNPFSVLYYFKNQELENYWFSSGTPTFLVELLKQQPRALKAFEQKEVSSDTLNASYEIRDLPLTVLLFQAGYLTIKKYSETTRFFHLDFPNEEVRLSISHLMISLLAEYKKTDVDDLIYKLRKSLYNNDLESFCTVLKSLFASIPYGLHVEKESYYHSLFYFLAMLLGIDTQSEVHTSKGRIDAVVTLPTRRYIFEFKLNKTGQEALEQIRSQKYYEKYIREEKPLILVGISFNYDSKELTLDWVSDNVAIH